MDDDLGELHIGPLSCTEPESYFDQDVVPLDANLYRRVSVRTWRSVAMRTPGRWGSSALVGVPTFQSCFSATFQKLMVDVTTS